MAMQAESDLDPRWSRAVDLLLEGLPKIQIARLCGVSRNTITAWTQHADVLREIQRRLDEREVEVRLRRSHQTTRYADRVRQLAESALHEAERRPLDRAAQRVVLY